MTGPAMLGVWLAAAAAAAPVAVPVAACSDPRAAPDPRCGEELDGRSPPPAPGATTAKAVLTGPRLAAKAAFWAPVRASELLEVHRVLPRLEALLTSDDELVGLRPELQYATGFLPSAGLRFFYRRAPLPGGELVARLRSAGPSTILGETAVTTPAWLGIDWRATYARRRDYLFAGIGPASAEALAARGQGPARYGADRLVTELRWSKRFLGAVRPALHGDIGRHVYTAAGVMAGPSVADVYAADPLACAQGAGSDGCVDPAALPGFQRGLRVAHAGGGLALELGREGRDGSGFTFAVDATYGQGVAGDPTRLTRLTVEGIVAAGGLDRLLLLRVRATAVEPRGGASVPFEELVSPTGQAGMRGFPEGRFRGPSGFVGTVEYRWLVAFNLDASLFVDVGTVAGPRFSGLASGRIFPTIGMGLRRYATSPAHYWLAPPGDGVQLAYAPDDGLRLLVSLAAF
jgi:hypothetical protein